MYRRYSSYSEPMQSPDSGYHPSPGVPMQQLRRQANNAPSAAGGQNHRSQQEPKPSGADDKNRSSAQKQKNNPSSDDFSGTNGAAPANPAHPPGQARHPQNGRQQQPHGNGLAGTNSGSQAPKRANMETAAERGRTPAPKRDYGNAALNHGRSRSSLNFSSGGGGHRHTEPPPPPKKKNPLLGFLPPSVYNPETKKIFGFLEAEDLLLAALILMILEDDEQQDSMLVYALLYILLGDKIDLSRFGLKF